MNQDWHCSRCNRESGMYGHNMEYCTVSKKVESDFHFCCPGNCELQLSEKQRKNERLKKAQDRLDDLIDQLSDIKFFIQYDGICDQLNNIICMIDEELKRE
jgi:hypothetical protein